VGHDQHLALTLANPAGTRRFLFLFFKKEALSCGSKQPLSMIVPEEIIPERAISLFYVKPDNSIKNNLARAVKIFGNPQDSDHQPTLDGPIHLTCGRQALRSAPRQPGVRQPLR
jgi:hypothetical protein